jgi:hypothetical protein
MPPKHVTPVAQATRLAPSRVAFYAVSLSRNAASLPATLPSIT